MKKLLALILAMVMCFSLLAACGSKDEGKGNDAASNLDADGFVVSNTAAPAEGKTWRKEIVFAGGTSAFEYPDPQGSTSMQHVKHHLLTHDRLVWMDPATGELKPMLAEKWDVSADGMVYTFYLRKDVKFHNGEPLTADDVVFTAQRGARETTTAQVKKQWTSAVWEEVDEYTVKATLNTLDADFLGYRSTPYMGILNREACEADDVEGAWIGTGLWILDEFRGQDGATWVRNDNYWGETTPTERLTLRHIPEPSTALIALENGEISFFRGLSALALEDTKKNEKTDVVKTISSMCTFLGFNQNKEGPWNDVNFRKALAYAIDYQGAIQGSTYAGHAEQALTFWGHEQCFGYTKPETKYSYDEAKAKEYLAKSSYKGETIEIMCYGSTWGKIGEVLAGMFDKIGVKCTVLQAESANYNPRITAGEFDLCCYTSSFPPFASQISNYMGNNTGKALLAGGHVANADKIKELAAQGSAETDDAKRKEIYAELQELWMQDLVNIPLMHNIAYDGIEAGIEGVYWVGSGEHDFRYIRIAE